MNRLESFRAEFSGQVITADAPEYNSAREVWNGQIDRRPAVIARCAGAHDVTLALKFAQDEALEIAVRGGGHNFGGAAVCDDGIVVDLSAMRDVVVDPARRRARCGGGATWADLDFASQKHALAVPGGTISHTGVGGLTLGGGFGWLIREHGLTCDNLVSAQVVTVSGDILRASSDDHPDMFWALRGGGGNFGVVTEFEFEAHPAGPMVDLGLFFWPLRLGKQALTLAREITENLPAGMGSLIASLNAPPAPFVAEQHHFTPGYALVIVGFDVPENYFETVRTIRNALPPLFEFVTPLPYTELQKMLDASAPWGILAYEKSVYLDSLSDDVISLLVERIPRKISPMSFVPIFPFGGAFHDVDDHATAFGGSRRTGLAFNAAALATEPDVLAEDREWVREMIDGLAPYATNAGSYVNFLNDYAEQDRVRAAYGAEKYARLAEIKSRYDPENLLHRNPNITPRS